MSPTVVVLARTVVPVRHYLLLSFPDAGGQAPAAVADDRCRADGPYPVTAASSCTVGKGGAAVAETVGVSSPAYVAV